MLSITWEEGGGSPRCSFVSAITTSGEDPNKYGTKFGKRDEELEQRRTMVDEGRNRQQAPLHKVITRVW